MRHSGVDLEPIPELSAVPLIRRCVADCVPPQVRHEELWAVWARTYINM